MQRAMPSEAPDRPASDAAEATADVDLTAASARIDGGLLMVFGPDGDPLPPRSFAEAARAQDGVSIPLEGEPVPVGRVADVLEAQSRGRLTEAEDGSGDAWIRAMLGCGPAPDEASLEELAAEGEHGQPGEVMLFGDEVLLSLSETGVFLLRPASGDEAADGVVIADGTGSDASHAELVEALSAAADDPGDGTLDGVAVEIADGEVRITAGDGRVFHIRACSPSAAPSSVLLAPDGEAFAVDRLAGGVPPGAGEGAGPAPQTRPGDVPERVVIGPDGLLDLHWLSEAAASAVGGEVERATLRNLPAAVRPSRGVATGEGAYAVEDLSDLTLIATPEGLEPFTLHVTVEGAGRREFVEVVVEAGTEPAVDEATPTPEAMTLDVAFPPPLSPLNDPAHFTLVVVQGVPPGATLSAGVPGRDGRWSLLPGDLQGLGLAVPAGTPLPCRLSAVAVVVENRDGVLATVRSEVMVGPHARSGEAGPVGTLDLRPLVEEAEVEGRRVEAVALTGLPPASDLSRGMFDRVSGCWVLRRDEVQAIQVTLPADCRTELAIKATAVAASPGGRPVATSRSIGLAGPGGGTAGVARVEQPRAGFFRSLAERRA